MATPINTFKTVTANLTTNTDTLYTSPPITSTIILMAQITNVGATTEDVTAYHYDGTSISTELVKDFPVPTNDAVGVLTGKLILMPGQSFTACASANSALKITLSLLETR